MVSLIFILLFPVVLLWGSGVVICVLVIDAIYDVGKAIYRGIEPRNKYRKE